MTDQTIMERLARLDEDGISAAELEELVGELESDPSARDELVLHYMLGHGIARNLRSEKARETGNGMLTERKPLRWWAIGGLAAAAGVLAAVGVWWFGSGGSRSDGSEILTGMGQTIALRFEGEDTLVEMAENTKLRVVGGAIVTGTTVNVELVQAGPGKVIQLEFGSIKVSVAKQTDGRSFMIKSQQVEIRVVGTKFSVNVGSDKKQTRVDVQEGVVKVRQIPDGVDVYVRAGVWATVEEGKALEICENAVRRIDDFVLPEEIRKAAAPHFYIGGAGFAFDGKLLWVVNEATALLFSVNPATRSVQDRIDLSGSCRRLESLASGGDSLWGVGRDKSWQSKLFRISPSDGRCETTELRGECEKASLAYGGGYLWLWQYVRENTFTLTRIDPSTRRVLSTVDIRKSFRGHGPLTLMWLNGGIHILEPPHVIIRIDPNNGKELVRNILADVGPETRGFLTVTSGTGSGFWALRIPAQRAFRLELLSAVRVGGKE